MIEITKLRKRFKDKVAVDDLSLSVNKGEILGFLGPNGAGKTTTVKMLTGMLIPDSGGARVAGFDVSTHSLEVKKRIGYVPESGALFESLTAWEYLELIADLHHLERPLARRRTEEFLTLFGLIDEKDQQLSSFSKGMKQKVLLASAFLHNPDVLFLDEPLNGLDVNAALVVKELLKKFASQGRTIMFCSHILEVVERICTRVAIIHEGRLLTVGTAFEITKQASQPTLEAAFSSLIGSRDVDEHTKEFLQALEDV
ncbi:ABC transporter ATP-binding protein [bacterium]|nr:ABC transporter ATP-binding protein [bacterium]